MAKQPNIIFLMTDQQRFDTIGALGNPIIQTPGLESYCSGGNKFYIGVLSISCMCSVSL